jgi:hypothetical protein
MMSLARMRIPVGKLATVNVKQGCEALVSHSIPLQSPVLLGSVLNENVAHGFVNHSLQVRPGGVTVSQIPHVSLVITFMSVQVVEEPVSGSVQYPVCW